MILFPADSLSKNQVETDYRSEWDAAQAAGFTTRIFDFDALLHGESAREILRFLPRESEEQTIVLRSWMMPLESYAQLEQMARERGFSFLTSARDYELAHHFPNSYPLLENHTPRSVVVSREEFERGGDLDFAPIEAALQTFGDAPLVVKDFVKSQKHNWHEACFIPRASDLQSAEKVVRRFLALQGERLVGGVVLREFLQLKSVGTHPKSGLPLTAEWRIFAFDGSSFFVESGWNTGDYGGLQPDLDFLKARIRDIPCRFFSIDIALAQVGDWTVIEIGDGQVSGLPNAELAPAFFRALRSVAPTLL